ncbi:MAG: toll/interleukin-1 receptor domain-containing protein [Gemmatimonadota bacterium]|jgi:hypothetical protein|nr:toll/interleukin-1 receptor domain-containing protein [Gemmatimonadota bacterium]
MNSVDLFLSHSSADEKIAKALIELLRDAFHLEPGRIRCTSVTGYKLKTGAHAESELRREIHHARVFIGVLSEVSLESAYVLFELGARWGMMQDYGMYSGTAGSKHKLFPVLAAGATGSMLRDPLKAYNALSYEKAGDLHQLIGDIGEELRLQPGSPAAYQDKIDAVIRTSKQLKAKRVRDAKQKAAKAAALPGTTKELATPRRTAGTKRSRKPGADKTAGRRAKKQ